MKALLCLALFLTISSAFAYFPSWKPIKYEGDSLEITDVYSQFNPKPGQKNFLTICGTALAPLEVGSYFYQIGKENQRWVSGTTSIIRTRVSTGENYCYLFNYVVPLQAKGAYSLEFTFTSLGNLGGVHIDFEI